MFVRGDNYASGNFSTRTGIVDLRTGQEVANLEKMPVFRNGERFFSNRNFNFWGVTFAHDDDHFYASLGSGSKTFLLKGSMRAQTLRVIHTKVECPSLSPGSVEDRVQAQRRHTRKLASLTVLNLKTMRETRLAGRPDRRPGRVARQQPRALRERQRRLEGPRERHRKADEAPDVRLLAGRHPVAGGRLRGKDSNLDYLIQSQASYH